MANSKHFTPAVIAGLVLVSLTLLTMLVATGVFLWRTRLTQTIPAPVAKFGRELDIEERTTGGTDEKEGVDTPNVAGKNIRNGGAILDVILPSEMPRLFRVAARGGGSVGVEVCVTPPTPVGVLNASGSPERRVRFETVPVSQSEATAVWFFL
ncbi:hypothetical protein BKA93DRAFT_829772 [Sparassis latifolia]|uniref:Uncharacterized protein n=1 Tax=Sparassis crispa TaxID=139825 RepID=A0A401GZX1_9APHY|nr:hypothetical protein SCP_1104030 [Sparassis crispa]GBE87726.1 hypothetical protein SCP_1104030 [Sparassis crispa]